MHPFDEQRLLNRRQYLTSTASGLGLLGLGSLLSREGLLRADDAHDSVNPMKPRAPHFAPKAKNCIMFFLEGAPSQIDLFDPKPKLNEMDGQKLPESMTKNVRFAFIQKDTVKLMGTKRKFAKRDQISAPEEVS